MPVEINWGLANQQPSFGQSVLGGYQSGQQIGQQAQQAQQAGQVRSALSGYGTDPDGSINALIQAGAVQQASALSGLRQQQAKQHALSALGQSMSPGVTAAQTGSVPNLAASPPATASASSSPNPVAGDMSGITVKAAPPSPTLYGLTTASPHVTSDASRAAQAAALAAGVDPSTISAYAKLALEPTADEEKINQNAQGIASILSRTANITAPGDTTGNSPATLAARKQFALNQISQVFPNDPASATALTQAANNFDYSNDSIGGYVDNYMRNHDSLMDVFKNARQDAGDQQKQENFETTQDTTKRGQDLSHAASMASVSATIRGQDLRQKGQGGYAPFGMVAPSAAGSPTLPKGFIKTPRPADVDTNNGG